VGTNTVLCLRMGKLREPRSYRELWSERLRASVVQLPPSVNQGLSKFAQLLDDSLSGSQLIVAHSNL